MYTRSGVYLDPALKRSYTVLGYTREATWLHSRGHVLGYTREATWLHSRGHVLGYTREGMYLATLVRLRASLTRA